MHSIWKRGSTETREGKMEVLRELDRENGKNTAVLGFTPGKWLVSSTSWGQNRSS